MSSQWEAVIGLEIHTQLSTRSKIFSGVATAYGITYVSTGLENKQALKSSLAMVVIAVVLYYPLQVFFNHFAAPVRSST